MIRDLGQPVSALHLCEDHALIAGGWDGELRKWNAEGDLLWSATCEDRIEAILPIGDRLVVTTGLHVSCLENGEILWSHALEGSADMLAEHEGTVIATSSVYDIEHGDFMESAIWKFSIDGEELSVDRMDERPWFVHSNGSLIIGLGRPRCGLLVDGSHQELASDSPVTCGLSGRSRILFGHADGTVSTDSADKMSTFNAGVESLVCTEQGFVAALENGDLKSLSPDGELIWESSGSQITCQTDGFSETHWCGRNQAITGVVEVRSATGEIIAQLNTARPRIATSDIERVVFGFEDGQILLWEKDLFQRRIDTSETEENEHRNSLAAKLRSLRK